MIVRAHPSCRVDLSHLTRRVFLMSHKCEISSGDSSFLQPANYFPHMFQKILSHEKKNNFNQIIQNITNNMKRRNMNNQRNHQSGYFWSKNV